ncbi:glycosyltransferase involved in cell wall biosynthesis [Arcticibacter tournemirensis]|uniref:Glycosyltransferase n=1 Tax=Arcticibacter tournemirensis TaxID=699437 RepID=A0A5M9HCH8_9SPHI|nr:glycosyltransferase [Arcticibacter tournemirensis]KAA8484656.1 glycosyltransferase [Arcticibacter tournemirensis]TQM47053.1 glycosyltransferase involved in cell wall biosynthesis [Arcticibacter tournemirensis]
MKEQREFGMNNKIKVVVICHFSSPEVQSKLTLWKKTDFYAAWIPNLLEGLKNYTEYEIHVISPHLYLKRDANFEIDGIFYHFFSIGIPVVNRNWPAFFNLDLYTNFYFNRRKIKKLIDRIKPRLINLQGAENSYYSSSVLDVCQKYPVLVTIQGFVSLECEKKGRYKKHRINTEAKIINECRYFGGDPDSMRLIEKIKTEAFNFYKYYYPNGSNIHGLAKLTTDKEADLLYWGRITKEKGAEDFLLLVRNLKVDFPDLRTSIIGPVEAEYLKRLKERIVELGCERNITIKGFIRSSDDLYAEVLRSRILVIPTYNDRFPTVLREGVCLKLAVVAYSTGSIPEFNKADERILLANPGDIKQMTTHVSKLLTDERYFEDLTNKAFDYGMSEFSIENNCDKLINAYKDILNREIKLKNNV